jgi:hypothetical protein
MVTASAQVEYAPTVCDTSTSAELTPEAIPAETTTAEPSRAGPKPPGRTNPAPEPPTPSPQATQLGSEPNTTEPNTTEPNTTEPLSAWRPAATSTTSHLRRGDCPTRPSPPAPINRRPAGEKSRPHPASNPRPHQARQQGPARRKQTPSASNKPAESSQQQTRNSPRRRSRSRRILQRHEAIPADVEHCCGHESRARIPDTNPGTAHGMAFPVRGRRCACRASGARLHLRNGKCSLFGNLN